MVVRREEEAAQPPDRCADLRSGLLERAECTLGMHPLLQPVTECPKNIVEERYMYIKCYRFCLASRYVYVLGNSIS